VWQDVGVNWHQVLDEMALEMDGVIARELRADPSKLNLAAAWIEKFLADPDYSIHSKDALTEWLVIIRLGLPRVLEALADSSDEGQRLRQSSPFAVIMPQDERRQILAKYEARRPRTHPAGV
jgi:hypothetical protein